MELTTSRNFYNLLSSQQQRWQQTQQTHSLFLHIQGHWVQLKISTHIFNGIFSYIKKKKKNKHHSFWLINSQFNSNKFSFENTQLIPPEREIVTMKCNQRLVNYTLLNRITYFNRQSSMRNKNTCGSLVNLSRETLHLNNVFTPTWLWILHLLGNIGCLITFLFLTLFNLDCNIHTLKRPR